ncbi:MAG: alpha/beta hydrolase [Methylomonas lenta]|nr:alpha/beta hydrolase [Methylomonas lenta]
MPSLKHHPLFLMFGLLTLALGFSLWLWLRPMSTNFLNYLFWKYTSRVMVQTGTLKNHGANIKYVAYGSGEPVLLLHGGLSNKLSWFSQLPWLVEKGRRVILIDTRGHGESTTGHAALNYQTFADDTLKVLDKLKIQLTDIIGWSDGGIIALILGLEAPHRVHKIVAISANFHPSGLITAGDAEQHPNAKLKLLAWLRAWWSGAGDRHESLEAQIKHLWRVAPQLDHADLQAIAAPTLVIAGENDIIDLPHSGELAQSLKQGQLEIVLGAGHASPVTHAEQINRLIASFLHL